MASNNRGRKQTPRKRGPNAETLQIDGNWKVAVGKALGRGKPQKASLKKKRRSK